MNAFLEGLLRLLYPPKCVFCHRLLEDGEPPVCSRCEKALPRTENAGRQRFPYVSVCVAPLYYEDRVRDSLRRFKFANRREYAWSYGPMVAACIREAELAFDCLSWVPLSRKRLRKRGYDQCFLLAQAVGRALDCAPEPLLRKVRHTPPQSQTGAAEKRRANVLDAYEVCSPEVVTGRRVLLLDDIVTTGSTLSECARILRTAGAKDVICAAVARRRD